MSDDNVIVESTEITENADSIENKESNLTDKEIKAEINQSLYEANILANAINEMNQMETQTGDTGEIPLIPLIPNSYDKYDDNVGTPYLKLIGKFGGGNYAIDKLGDDTLVISPLKSDIDIFETMTLIDEDKNELCQINLSELFVDALIEAIERHKPEDRSSTDVHKKFYQAVKQRDMEAIDNLTDCKIVFRELRECVPTIRESMMHMRGKKPHPEENEKLALEIRQHIKHLQHLSESGEIDKKSLANMRRDYQPPNEKEILSEMADNKAIKDSVISQARANKAGTSQKPSVKKTPTPGVNDPCPCGKINENTGNTMKYKKCCKLKEDGHGG